MLYECKQFQLACYKGHCWLQLLHVREHGKELLKVLGSSTDSVTLGILFLVFKQNLFGIRVKCNRSREIFKSTREPWRLQAGAWKRQLMDGWWVELSCWNSLHRPHIKNKVFLEKDIFTEKGRGRIPSHSLLDFATRSSLLTRRIEVKISKIGSSS